MIEWRDISVTYPGPVPVRALAATSLRIDAGDFIAITGPSGSGKSSMLSVMGLMERPSSGSYLLRGVDVSGAGDKDRAALRTSTFGFVFQAFHLIDHRSAVENVQLGMLYGSTARPARRGLAIAALHRVGLRHRLWTRPRFLSGGERQRVAIARAVVHSPEILLADEPTGNLDSASTESVLELLGHLNDDGQTIVVVTHDRAVADRARRRITIVDGVVDWPSSR